MICGQPPTQSKCFDPITSPSTTTRTCHDSSGFVPSANAPSIGPVRTHECIEIWKGAPGGNDGTNVVSSGTWFGMPSGGSSI